MMDFKPNASKENEQKVASQIYLYASGLSFRSSIPLKEFRCAWFDDSVYYEFNPRGVGVRFSQTTDLGNDKLQIREGKAANSVSRPSNRNGMVMGRV